MLSNVEHWLVSAAVVVALLVVLFACICGCRKKAPKNELMGLAGLVKITNPEENLDTNYHCENGSPAIVDNNRTSADSAEAHRRVATSTANRSLPDLPVDQERMRTSNGPDTVWEASEPHSDACSALYATVTENKEAAHLLAAAGELVAGGRATGASDDGKGSAYSSLSQNDDAFAPYAQLKGEHPYDKLRKSEHPYSQVGGATSRRPRSSAPAAVGVSSPVAPPRQRKTNSFHAETTTTETETIAAATAISGHVSANQELPYMTPPIVPPPVAAAAEGQAHFSGDSQDSSKGYTSISVREPLANIKAQQRGQRRPIGEDVYTTVSDDSEEVYADIEDAQGVYTSGSETYAQILPPPEQMQPPRDDPSAPPPPSVDSLKHVAQAHSRQASSSSAASSVANLGSPKPEKRQANSPLPPPPPAGPASELYATVDKKSSAAAAAATERTLEEMYAKVMKRTQRAKGSEDPTTRRLSTDSRSHSTESEPGPDESVATAEPPPTDGQSPSSVDPEGRGNEVRQPYREEEPSLSSLVPATSYVDPGYEVVQRSSDADYEDIRRSMMDPNYEEVQRLTEPRLSAVNLDYEVVERPSADPNYEELRPQVTEKASASDEPGYASIGSLDSGYEKFKGKSSTETSYKKRAKSLAGPAYEKVDGKSLAERGYEKVRSKSVVEPSYAKIDKSRRPKSSVGEELGYARVHRPGDEAGSTFSGEIDPNYESVASLGPNYESVASPGPNYDSVASPGPNYDSVASLDPNYESVASLGPNYETVASLDPNYESVASPGPNYESVDYASLPGEPPYERLNNSRDSSSDVSPSARRDSSLEYERQSLSTDTDYEDVRVN